ncbi:hypothetical protein M501DRAFT_992099 [Patellaria atrata CBS 101060]|uniref:Uncharacterized protein n=1 Tax=Patellaria atrata CBS 101060 TaxID=1346257 RepID=A0A9P4SAT8_9PEZI|nr:hypothetical protein M501DRAFT_992099 [Patellaria atrata CBS 101060]
MKRRIKERAHDAAVAARTAAAATEATAALGKTVVVEEAKAAAAPFSLPPHPPLPPPRRSVLGKPLREALSWPSPYEEEKERGAAIRALQGERSPPPFPRS